MKITKPDKWRFIKYDDIFPDPFNGIFSYIHNAQSPLEIKTLLDQLFPDYMSIEVEYLSRSGLKLISRQVKTLLDYFDLRLVDGYYTLSEDAISSLIEIIESRFARKWTKLTATVLGTYDPLSPYQMRIEEISSDDMITNETSNSNRTDTLGTSRITGSTSDRNDGRWGFNSESDVPTDKSSVELNETVSNTGSDNSEVGGTRHYERNNPKTSTITKKGNIGNKTLQELLNEEREVWQWQILDVIFKDIDSVLCLSNYII